MSIQPVSHEFPPFYGTNAKVLILGTIPSPKSREHGFYYMHPQNRFWRVMADAFRQDFPETLPQRKEFLLRNRIALWDVLQSCEIDGASDASIRNARPNDLLSLLHQVPVEFIFTTGKTAEKYYNKLLRHTVGRECIPLPSTSPANCRLKYEELLKQYQKIAEVLQ